MPPYQDPEDDLIQPIGHSSRQQQDPFDDDNPFETSALSGGPAQASGSAAGRQHGYTLDPFFDE